MAHAERQHARAPPSRRGAGDDGVNARRAHGLWCVPVLALRSTPPLPGRDDSPAEARLQKSHILLRLSQPRANVRAHAEIVALP